MGMPRCIARPAMPLPLGPNATTRCTGSGILTAAASFKPPSCATCTVPEVACCALMKWESQACRVSTLVNIALAGFGERLVTLAALIAVDATRFNLAATVNLAIEFRVSQHRLDVLPGLRERNRFHEFGGLPPFGPRAPVDYARLAAVVRCQRLLPITA